MPRSTTEAGLNALLSLKIGDTTHLAIAKALQRHPVRQTVTHVDFQVVRRDEIVTAEVRIALVGESEAVHRAEGTIDQEMLSLQIKARPGDVPAVIEVDISALEVGDSLACLGPPAARGRDDRRRSRGPGRHRAPAAALEAEVEAEGRGEPRAAAGGEPPAASDEG